MINIIKSELNFVVLICIFIGTAIKCPYAEHSHFIRKAKPNNTDNNILGTAPRNKSVSEIVEVYNKSSFLFLTQNKEKGKNDSIYIQENSFYLQNCSSSFELEGKAHSDINMFDVYDSFNFSDEREFGDWQANWNITVNTSRFTDTNKLNVFLVPHSHDDAGWLATFEQYFVVTVRTILNLLLEKLDKNPSMKFIQVEVSFLSIWWDEISKQDRMRLKKIVERKQLEFVTGGWVMADEANSHYYSLLIQLFEGNQWLKQHLGYRPINGWSIDPFGQSPTMAYILKRAGFRNMVIQRTHYLVKQYLGNKQKLEFFWRQSWDKSGTTDILTHMMPFDSYATPSTCGPNQSVCWSTNFGPKINQSNIENISEPLVEQYKKKAMLYQTNNILVPLGGDFAWNQEEDWDGMIANLGRIKDYVNNKTDLHAQIQFGTLNEYFERMRSEGVTNKIDIPTLSGDFYTYADNNDHYWSGYFTSRPFHKALDRRLISHLKAAHMAYAFISAELFKRSGNLTEFPFMRKMFSKLRYARRTLSIFQHHDGITGTSKDAVMKDYAEKLMGSIKHCEHVMQESIQILSHLKELYVEELKNLNHSELGPFHMKFESMTLNPLAYSLPEEKVIILNSFNPQCVVTVYNPIAQIRTTLVTVKVQIPEDAHSLHVVNLKEQFIDADLMPIFINNYTVSRNVFQLQFVAQLEAMAISSFIVRIRYFPEPNSVKKPNVIFLAQENASIVLHHPRFDISISKLPKNISNGHIAINFDTNGFVESIEMNGITYDLKIRLFTYGSKGSGLYLFNPDGPAELLKSIDEPIITIVTGKFQSYIEIRYPTIQHKIILHNYKGIDKSVIEIRNEIDLSSETDFELLMRFESGINSGKFSYTDLNAFQMIQRKRFESLPIQGQYYPMPSATFIEDAKLRMTVLGSHPVGTASLDSGNIDVMMDRTLSTDDNLGVGQGSGKSIKNANIFKLILESSDCQDDEIGDKSPMLSLKANLVRNELLHPVHVFRGLPTEFGMNFTGDPLNRITDYLPSISQRIPCDVEVVDAIPLVHFPDSLDDLKYSPIPEAAVLLHRVGFDARFYSDEAFTYCASENANFGVFCLNDVFNNLLQTNATLMTLSFLKKISTVHTNEKMFMDPMELYAIHVKYK